MFSCRVSRLVFRLISDAELEVAFATGELEACSLAGRCIAFRCDEKLQRECTAQCCVRQCIKVGKLKFCIAGNFVHRLSWVLSEDGAILGFDCISKAVIVRFLLTCLSNHFFIFGALVQFLLSVKLYNAFSKALSLNV